MKQFASPPVAILLCSIAGPQYPANAVEQSHPLASPSLKVAPQAGGMILNTYQTSTVGERGEPNTVPSINRAAIIQAQQYANERESKDKPKPKPTPSPTPMPDVCMCGPGVHSKEYNKFFNQQYGDQLIKEYRKTLESVKKQ